MLFKVSNLDLTAISIGDSTLPVVDGVVDVEPNVGETQGWHRLDEKETAAHQELQKKHAAGKPKK